MSEERRNIQSLRESSSQLNQAHQQLDDLVTQLQRSVQRLNEDWHHPAVTDVNAIIASLTRQLGDVSGMMQRASSRMDQVAAQSEQELSSRDDTEPETTDAEDADS